MPSNLRIAVFRGCAFFKIHCLEDGVFSVLLFDGQHRLLAALFPLTSGCFFGAAALSAAVLCAGRLASNLPFFLI